MEYLIKVRQGGSHKVGSRVEYLIKVRQGGSHKIGRVTLL